MSLTLTPAITASTALVGCVSPSISRAIAVRRLHQFCRRTRTLVLTFDDGPGPVLTPTLLDLLRSRNIHATFFPTGFRTQEHPHLLDQVQADGHEIGSHTHDHTNAWRVAPWRAVEDMQRGFDTLSTWVEADGLFRPPYGKLNLTTTMALRERQAQVAWWTLDSRDTRSTLPTPASVADEARAAGGGVVLMHDFDRGPDRHAFVIEATERLLQLAGHEGWRVCMLGDVLREMRSQRRSQPSLPACGAISDHPVPAIDLSIVVVSWNTRELLRDCLDSIRNTAHVSHEVLVVDNASDDGSTEMVECSFPEVRLIRNDENVGFARASNQAINLARGRSILLLNSDTEVLGDVLDNACRYMDRNDDVAVLGVRVLNTDHTLQPTCFRDPSLLNQLLLATGLHRLKWPRFFGRERMRHWKRDTACDVDVVSGCFLMARQAALRSVGLLDEQFFFFDEEADWCARFRQHGWRVRFAPVGEIVHHGSASVGRLSEPKELLLARARMRLQYKRGGWSTAIATWVIFVLQVVVRIAARVPIGLLPGRTATRRAALNSVRLLKNLATIWPHGVESMEPAYEPVRPALGRSTGVEPSTLRAVGGKIADGNHHVPTQARAA